MTTTARNERQFDYTTLEAWGIPRGTDCDHVVTIEDTRTIRNLKKFSVFCGGAYLATGVARRLSIPNRGF